MSIDNQKLILTPNGYKAGKNYSIKPTDGSGDFTMSRGTSKTRVKKDKVIESVGNDVLPADYTNADCPVLALEPQRTNLLQYSEEFDNAMWSNANVGTAPVIQSGFVAPDGSNTAFKITNINQNSFLYENENNYTGLYRSIYARVESGTAKVNLLSHHSNNNNLFELNTNWQRFEILNLTSSIGSISFYAVDFRGSTNTSEVILWGAQVEQASTPTSYIPTSGSAVTRNQDILTNDLTSTIDASYSALIKVEADNSRLKIEDTDTGFDLPLNGTGNIAMVVDSSNITFHFPDNGQANTTVTYDKPADLRNLEILSKLGRTGLAILSIENGVISQSKIDDWVSGTISSDWLQDYSSQTDFNSEFRDEDWDYFPAIDLSSGTDFRLAWYKNNLTSFPAIDLSSGTNFIAAWFRNNLTSFPAIDLSSGTNFIAAWRENNLTSFPAIDLSSGTNFFGAWRQNNLTSFPAIDLNSGTNFIAAWRDNNLTSFPAIDLSSGTNFIAAWRDNNLTSFPAIDLSNGTNFQEAWRENNLTSFPAIDLSSGNTFRRSWENNNLTSFPSNMFDTNNASNYDSAFANNDLDQQSVDNILVSINTSAQANNITNGILGIDGGTNASPSTTGKAAADALFALGWTVNLNGYTPS